MSKVSTRFFVVGRHVCQLEIDATQLPRTLVLSASVDGALRWSSVEPGWREIGVGGSDAQIYVWSARRLVSIPFDEEGIADVVDTDEDIVCVFGISDWWLMLCETSVRINRGSEWLDRLEFDEAISGVHWLDDVQIVCEFTDGTSAQVLVDPLLGSVSVMNNRT